MRRRCQILTSMMGARHAYYKLHSHWNCVVLTSDMRRRLLVAMRKREPEAKKRADAFYAEKAKK